MKNSVIKNILVNLRALFSVNLNKRINENARRIECLEDATAGLDEKMTEKYYYHEVLGYFARHEEESQAYAKELAFLREYGSYCTFPYPLKQERDGVVSGFDAASGMPYVVHDGKKLYFASKYSESQAVEMYWSYIHAEKLLGVEDGTGAPHQYQSPKVHVEKGDVVFDIGAAEGLFALDQMDKASRVVIVESNPQWFLPLRHTFAPYGDKVIIVEKMVSATDTENTVSLKTLLSKMCDCPVFVKMDIEGSELPTITSVAETLKENNGIKIVAASYHRQYDADELKAIFDQVDYDSEFSQGYMLFHSYDTPIPPFFRHGVIRAKSNLRIKDLLS